MIKAGSDMILKVAGFMMVCGLVGLVAGAWWVTRTPSPDRCAVCD